MPLNTENTEALTKILALEADKGYADSAVIGGLDRFMRNWAAQAASSMPDRRFLGRFKKLGLANSNYALMTMDQRKEFVSGVLAFVVELLALPALSHAEGSSAEGNSESTAPGANAQKAAAKPDQPAGHPAPVGATGLPPLSGAQAKADPPPNNLTHSTSSGQAPNPKTAPPVTGASLDSPITVVKGVSANLAPKFEKLGVKTVRDLLYLFPNRHLDYSQRKTISQLIEGNEETIVANVWQTTEVRPGGRPSTEAIVGDETGNVRVVWFNNPYIMRQLPTNSRVVISGRVSAFQGMLQFQSPEWELLEDKELVHTGRLVPLYPLTAGLHPRQVRRLMKQFVDNWAWQAQDFLPAEIRQRCRFPELPQAIAQAHFPDTIESKDGARTRLAFDELFLLQLGVLNKKRFWRESQPALPVKTDSTLLASFLKSLPFTLTTAQDKALKEILADLARPQAMSRLLQGDVGSGKTVVATIALLMAAAGGFQGAIMAPTEILAGQHLNTICGLLSRAGKLEEQEDCLSRFSGILPGSFGSSPSDAGRTGRTLTVGMLTGALTRKRKTELQKLIREGEIDIVIGTHALIQEDVSFKKLGLAVIDEQHRFGVEQRSALRQKGFNPHILVMTATPIPRTLALTLYGDLDLSVINELPPGRLPVKTKWLKPTQRESAYAFIRKQIAAGRQAFIICPLVEESEAVQARAATAEYERLSRQVFPDLGLGLLHGRVSAKEKENIMRAFHDGELDILVATPVVEVGIDVPNATVMLVESADRFGLSQLHQFRGRVGRGAEQSYCMLLAENPSEVGTKRLDIIETTQDGFQLSEEDLKLRGPGEFFGTRQSGLPDLKMAKLTDVHILELARNEAIRLFDKDKSLTLPEHRPLAEELARVWGARVGEWS